MKRLWTTWTTVALIITLATLLAGCSSQSSGSIDIDAHKRIAGELRDTKLYEAAIDEYRVLLAAPNLDPVQKANINYLIARIYFDDIKNYDRAAAYFVRARALNPDGQFVDRASRDLVAALEKLGQSIDARRQLQESTSIETVPAAPGDVAVARVGGDPIWLSEVERQLQLLPSEVRQRYTHREGKIEFARQYVAAELMYRAAVREGYNEDPEIIREKLLLEKKLLVERYVADKIMPQLQIDTLDVRNYYAAHRADRYGDRPFDSVRTQVYMDYSQEKASSAYNQYLSRLIKAEGVEFLDHNVR